MNGSIIVFSDICGGWDEQRRFFEAIKWMKRDAIICLGDTVDDLADHKEHYCLAAVREHADHCILGDRDARHADAVLRKMNPPNADFVATLPTSLDLGNAVAFHASLGSNAEGLVNKQKIRNEGYLIRSSYPAARIALFGHTQVHGAWALGDGKFARLSGESIRLDPDVLTLVNPGALGPVENRPSTFARIDLDANMVRFSTLEQAERLAYKAQLVECFDSRWMGALTVDAWEWFPSYVEGDVQVLRVAGAGEPSIARIAERLASFDGDSFGRLPREKQEQYLLGFSYFLADDVLLLWHELDGLYDVPNPFESRMQYLNLKRRTIWPPEGQ